MHYIMNRFGTCARRAANCCSISAACQPEARIRFCGAHALQQKSQKGFLPWLCPTALKPRLKHRHWGRCADCLRSNPFVGKPQFPYPAGRCLQVAKTPLEASVGPASPTVKSPIVYNSYSLQVPGTSQPIHSNTSTAVSNHGLRLHLIHHGIVHLHEHFLELTDGPLLDFEADPGVAALPNEHALSLMPGTNSEISNKKQTQSTQTIISDQESICLQYQTLEHIHSVGVHWEK